MRSLGQFQTFFFFTERSHIQQKAQKHKKHKNHKDATEQKHKNANKRISDFFPLRCFLWAFFIFVCCKRFVICCAYEIFE